MERTKILIVEDEFVIAEDLKQILEDLDYEVIDIVTKFSQAIAILEEVKPDLILLDIILGGAKDGIDLAHYLDENVNIPYIFITSHADPKTINRVKEVNPLGYIIKPFEQDEIYASIELALSKIANSPDKNRAKILDKLSEREQDVLLCIRKGKKDQEIADELFISLNTVKSHVKNIYVKLEVKSRLEAAVLI